MKPKLESHFAWLDKQLSDKPFLMGEVFTIADAYLFALTGWGKAAWMKSVYNADIDFTPLGHLQAWYERVRNRPAVQRVLRDEGLSNEWHRASPSRRHLACALSRNSLPDLTANLVFLLIQGALIRPRDVAMVLRSHIAFFLTNLPIIVKQVLTAIRYSRRPAPNSHIEPAAAADKDVPSKPVDIPHRPPGDASS